jgi:hypothetical protein
MTRDDEDPLPDRLLAGDGGWPIFGPPVLGRSCGTCTFCCTMVPVEAPLFKAAGVKCEHVCGKGCGIYPNRPDPCRYWNCAWLYQMATAGMRRPDHAGYVVDPMPQELLINHKPAMVVQVWVDPKRPDAWRDPALLAYLEHVAARFRMPAMVRWSHPGPQAGQESMFLAAPCLTDCGWIERRGPMMGAEEFNELLTKAKLP